MCAMQLSAFEVSCSMGDFIIQDSEGHQARKSTSPGICVDNASAVLHLLPSLQPVESVMFDLRISFLRGPKALTSISSSFAPPCAADINM